MSKEDMYGTHLVDKPDTTYAKDKYISCRRMLINK